MGFSVALVMEQAAARVQCEVDRLERENAELRAEVVALRRENTELRERLPAEFRAEVPAEPQTALRSHSVDSASTVYSGEMAVDDQASRSRSTTPPPGPYTVEALSAFLASPATASSPLVSLATNPLTLAPWIPEDFAPNPRLNSAIPHAYSFVLRGSARRCVHGTSCTECEHFYTLAGTPPANTAPAWDASTGASVVATTLRHREVWRRPPSPPGFNNPAMASPAELASAREEAATRAHATALARLTAALNRDRYVFRVPVLNALVASGRWRCDLVQYRMT